MQVTVGGKTYRVDFRHSTVDFDIHRPDAVKGSRFTQCIISEMIGEESLEEIAEGFSYCHPNDQFSREVGRKRSLAKALKKLFPMPKTPEPPGANAALVAVFTHHDMKMARAKVKSQRKAFWDAYQGRLPDFFSKQRRVYAAIARERAYQDKKWGGPEHDKEHSLEYWISIAEYHIQLARTLRSRAELVQVAATITACLEVHGVVEGHEEKHAD